MARLCEFFTIVVWVLTFTVFFQNKIYDKTSSGHNIDHDNVVRDRFVMQEKYVVENCSSHPLTVES